MQDERGVPVFLQKAETAWCAAGCPVEAATTAAGRAFAFIHCFCRTAEREYPAEEARFLQ